MFSAEDYLYGWIAYIAGGVCLLIVLGYLLRKARAAWVRHVPVLVSAAILFTPVTAYPNDKHLAPACFVGLYEGLLASGDDLGFQCRRDLSPMVSQDHLWHYTFFHLQ